MANKLAVLEILRNFLVLA